MFISRFSWQAGIISGALLAGAVIGMPQCFGTAVASSASYYAFQFTNGTGNSQDSINLVLSGDQTSTPSGLSGVYENSLGGTSSASYSSGAGTTIAFSGTSSVSNTSTATVGFGWNGSLAPDITNAYWGSVATSNTISPLPLTASPPQTTADPWADITYDVSGTQYWFEEQFSLGTNPQITITNTNSDSETLSGAGYFISESYIPLDQLNFGSEPPPDISGSPFIPLPNLDGQTIPGSNNGSNGSLSFTIPLPTPPPLALAGVGAIGLLAVRELRRRRRGDGA
ncbi:MAG: hypothetical protein ACYCUV_13220 [Phycisphaerae bacterium]